MEQELIIYILLILTGALLSLGLCIYAGVRLRYAPGGIYYILMTFMASAFGLAYLFELTSPTLEQIAFWLRIEYIPLPFIPVFALLMSLAYAGRKLKGWVNCVLLLIPMSTTIIQITNDEHHLYYTSMKLRADAPFPIVQLEHGPYFHVHSVFLYGCMAASVIVLLLELRKVSSRFRVELLLMVAGLTIPVFAAFFYIGGSSPYGIDLGPVYLSVSFVLQSIALLRYQMFNAVPIARDLVFENMREGVLVLNERGEVTDYNAAMPDVIPALTPLAVGQSIHRLSAGEEQLAEIFRQSRESDYEVIREGAKLHYHIRFYPIQQKSGRSGTIVSFVNMTDRIQIEARLKYLASTDNLTQLLNRAALLDQSEHAIQELSGQNGELAVIMFDIDTFKQVNDTYGHGAGDTALQLAAAAARDVIGGRGIAGRYGGDEFILCIPNACKREAAELAEQIRRKVAEARPTLGSRQIHITSSFGVASARVGRGDDSQLMHALIQQADTALYTAKKMGRNCVQVYEDKTGAEVL
ncbi:histidine kinase N-terminal 7TM domain-containing diguanylate cyclase [Paenibacillus tarimensis]|uniref:histidine kinase N-terminal 7TM domain-containing diguanylate cyclase n=1 Tax=Paenibacillus tarimensis TaxID=416012 RepID=UPI001F17AE86|nr:histidine kinase N-terminal 7TM domain-containing protein [Paenibacillus tarimensis]MCF2944406.1 diguanylate cyclase [Paenibacillus tarimensis]